MVKGGGRGGGREGRKERWREGRPKEEERGNRREGDAELSAHLHASVVLGNLLQSVAKGFFATQLLRRHQLCLIAIQLAMVLSPLFLTAF